MSIKLPKLDRVMSIVTDRLTPSMPFHIWWQKVVTSLEDAFTRIDENIEDIETALDAAIAAQLAADDAQITAEGAQLTAETAQTTAENAQNTGADTSSAISLINSGVTGLSLTSTDAGTSATITISSHTRIYGDSSDVLVTGATLSGLSYDSGYFIVYDDPTRVGGIVSYLTVTAMNDATQLGSRHLVGYIVTPAASASDTVGRAQSPPGINISPEYVA